MRGISAAFRVFGGKGEGGSGIKGPGFDKFFAALCV